MAEEAVSKAVKILGELVIQKAAFLLDVEEQVMWLKDELQRMRGFLKDAGEKQAQDERIRIWVSEIREVARHAEDAIEIFTLKIDTSSGTLSTFSRAHKGRERDRVHTKKARTD